MRWMSVMAVLALAPAAWAEGEAIPGDPATGAELYQAHCAVCHGIAAKGNGPMAPILLLQPPDLTALVARYDGIFPLERVASRIDGRDPLVSHGSDMPVYGDFFEGRDVAMKTHTGQPLLTSRPIADLMAWLASIQE